MMISRNHFGVPQYPGDDARRLMVLLAAIDLLERPSVTALADFTSHDKETIEGDANRLQEQFGVTLLKIGDVYRLESWGPVLHRDGVQAVLKGW